MIAALPADGVLVFELTRAPEATLGLEDLLPFVRVETTDANGLEIPGELTAAYGRVAWRPTPVLAPEDTVTVTLAVENIAVAELEGLERCAVQDLELTIPVVVAGDEVTPVDDLGGTVDIERIRLPKLASSLDQLVCCDGALPSTVIDECEHESLSWDEGHCESLLARRRLAVDATLQWPEAESIVGIAGYVPVLSFRDETLDVGPAGQDSLGGLGSSAGCASLVVWDFVEQTSHVLDDTCIDAVGAGILGTTPRDPSEALAEACAEQPYTCAITDGAWDDSQCTPWDGVVPPQRQPETDSGGSESGDSESDDGTGGDDNDDDDDDDNDNDDADDDEFDDGGDDFSDEPSAGCNSPDEHDHSDDEAHGCAYCGQGNRRPPWLLMLLLLATRRRRRRGGRQC